MRHLGDGLGEDVAGDGAASARGIAGSVGYSSTGIVSRVNRPAPQVTDDLGAVGGDVDRLVGQGAGDVGEQPAGDQDGAGLGDLGRRARPGPRPRSRSSRGAGRRRRRPRAARRPGPGPAAGLGSARAAQVTASARTSRSTRNFTAHRPCVVAVKPSTVVTSRRGRDARRRRACGRQYASRRDRVNRPRVRMLGGWSRSRSAGARRSVRDGLGVNCGRISFWRGSLQGCRQRLWMLWTTRRRRRSAGSRPV